MLIRQKEDAMKRTPAKSVVRAAAVTLIALPALVACDDANETAPPPPGQPATGPSGQQSSMPPADEQGQYGVEQDSAAAPMGPPPAEE